MDVALANDRVIDQIQSVQPTLTQFVLAKDVLSCFSELSVIVAGPSQSWEDCVPLVKGAIQEAVREAKYCSEDSVTSYLESGRIKLCSSLEYGVVTTLETVITSTTVLMELVDSNNSTHKIYAPLMLAEKMEILMPGLFILKLRIGRENFNTNA